MYYYFSRGEREDHCVPVTVKQNAWQKGEAEPNADHCHYLCGNYFGRYAIAAAANLLPERTVCRYHDIVIYRNFCDLCHRLGFM